MSPPWGTLLPRRDCSGRDVPRRMLVHRDHTSFRTRTGTAAIARMTSILKGKDQATSAVLTEAADVVLSFCGGSKCAVSTATRSLYFVQPSSRLTALLAHSVRFVSFFSDGIDERSSQWSEDRSNSFQWPTGAGPPSLTLRRASASGTAASEISIRTQKTSV